MADETTASVIPIHQVRPRKKAKATPKTGVKTAVKSDGERPKASRQRNKTPAPDPAPASSEYLIPLDFPSEGSAESTLPVAIDQSPQTPEESAPAPAVTSPAVTPSRRLVAPTLLTIAAVALACVGITMNGWFARSLGSTDTARWLFLAVGVAADLVALVIPSRAAGLWRARHRASALTAWLVWAMTFAFAVTAGIGFASTNIVDVTMARASRVTPAVTAAQAALADAMTARNRECKGGVGKFCREREEVVNERQSALSVAMHSVEATADPQTHAAIQVVSWVSRGTLQPSENDFATLRLVLLALLPQIGGILLMLGRTV
ncbi:MAG TPA: hypothetical protein VFB02_01315 [Bradyrhizobium sp.]|nr:hypothetical protein [Bradyrhizobium sp.]